MATMTTAIDLTSRAMLASLTIRMWSAKKHDKKVSKEVSEQHNSDETMGKFNKVLVAKTALEEIQKIASAARTEFYTLTLPWQDDGSRVLTSTGYLSLSEKMKDFQLKFEDARDVFASLYRVHVSNSRQSLGSLFNENDYPSDAELYGKFDFSFRINPLPNADDFRVHMSASEANVIRERIERCQQEATDRAMQDVWDRMKTVVSKAADKLKAYKVTKDGIENIFRDSLIDNIRELLDIVPALNLTNDASVKAFADDMRVLCAYDAETLRENEHTRIQVAKAADDILSKMQAII